MVILLRKAIRSIWRSKSTYAACICLIAMGVASYAGFTQANIELEAAMNNMYEAQQFGHAFASVQGISPNAVKGLTRIPGISTACGRTTADVRTLNDDESYLNLHLISYDKDEESPLNQFLIIEGDAPGRGEILISQNFRTLTGLTVGDSVFILTDTGQTRPVISGIAISPEYISEIANKNIGSYAYMPLSDINVLKDNQNLFNDLIFLLEEGVSFKDVELPLEEALTQNGMTGLYSRDDHVGHKELWLSIDSLSSTAGMISFIFLTVAILVLYILLRRVIEQERIQIGTMKAFGISDRRIMVLYLGYGAAVALCGCALGYILGLCVSAWATGLFFTIFQMPAVTMMPSGLLLLKALCISAAAGLLGAAMGARAVLKLSPAESMRSAAPPAMKRKKAMRRVIVIPPSISMALRSISRSKFRSSFVAGGMAVSFAILTFMSTYASLMDDVLMAQFDYIQFYDMKLTLEEPAGYTAALQSAYSLNGVDAAEGVLELPVTVYHSNRSQEDVLLTGLDRDSKMQRLYDSGTKAYLSIPEEGVMISYSLAEKLGVAVGDELVIATQYTKEEKLPVKVTALIGENMGYSAYMELGNLCDLLGTGKTASSLLLQTDGSSAVKELLANGHNSASLTEQAELRQMAQSSLDQTLGANVGLFAVIGLGVAFAIIISTASISLSERAREYATLRVLGMEPGEVGKILTHEYMILTAFGFLPGIPLAIGLKALVITSFSDEALSLSIGIAPFHFLVGGTVCLLTTAFACLSSTKQIGKLEMTEVLKERE